MGQEASAAAAGMLSPQAEADGPTPFFELAHACRNRYADWVGVITELSGTPVSFRTARILNLALTDQDAAALKQRRDWQTRLGLAAEWIGGDEARRREPILADNLAGALYLPEEARVDPVALTAAVAAAGRKLGVEFEEHATATSLIISGGRATGVTAARDRRFHAGHVVIAAGAWASRIDGLPIPRDWIEPRRGQILVLRFPDPIGHILYTHGAYLVPGDEGEVIAGTTVEQAGFERAMTAGGIRSIVERVSRFAPGVETGAVVSMAVGLRPESRDGLPLLGPVAELPGLVLAIGHYRNGILLAPLTGILIAESIVGGRVPDALVPFLPDRALARDPGAGVGR